MSTPIIYNWPKLYIGSSYGPLDFTIKDSNDDVIDITGWSAFCQIRSSDGTLVLDLAPTVYGNGTDGTFRVDIASASTSDLTEQAVSADFIVQDASSKIYPPLFSGPISVVTSVSQTS